MNTEKQNYEYCHIFIVKEKDKKPYIKKFNTDRTSEWTCKQYRRNREIEYMNLI